MINFPANLCKYKFFGLDENLMKDNPFLLVYMFLKSLIGYK